MDHQLTDMREQNMSVHYLVDFENVHEAGLYGMSSLAAEDCVYIFHTSPTDRIALSCLDDVRAWVKVIIVPPGKQSLDMHLGSFLGYLIGKEDDPDTRYAIVSHDSDYIGITDFWNRSYNMVDKVQCIDRIRPAAYDAYADDISEAPFNESAEKAAIRECIFNIFSKHGVVGINGLPCMMVSELCARLNGIAAYNNARKRLNMKPMQFLTEECGDILRVQRQWQQDWVYLLAGCTSSVHPGSKQEDLPEAAAGETVPKEEELDIREIGDPDIGDDPAEPEDAAEETAAADDAGSGTDETSGPDCPEETSSDESEFLSAAKNCIRTADESGRNDRGHVRASVLRDRLATLPEFRTALKESGMKPIPFIQQLFAGEITVYREKGIFWAAESGQPENEDHSAADS